MVGITTYRSCPKCHLYEFIFRGFSNMGRCNSCGHTATAESFIPGGGTSGGRGTFFRKTPRRKPKPTAFSRTKGRKPDKAKLAALQEAIDNMSEQEGSS